MTAEDELAPVLAELRRQYEILPFLDRMLLASEAVFRRLPEEMVDLIAASPDFSLPKRGTPPVWIQIAGEGDAALEVIVARPKVDGELWVIAPPEVGS